jgi:hypothetical protein
MDLDAPARACRSVRLDAYHIGKKLIRLDKKPHFPSDTKLRWTGSR